MKKLFGILVLVAVSLNGCYLEDSDLPFIGYEYFPTDIAHWVEYRVDSTWQDDPIGPIGSAEAHYFLRELNESNFMDEEGRPAVRVERHWMPLNGSSWSVKDVWHRVKTEFLSEQNEENVIFIKHKFPIREGRSWDGNARTTLESLVQLYHQTTVPAVWNYEYVNVHQPYSVNGFTFDSTVTVIQFDRRIAVGLSIYAKEVYAKNIGLIHKQRDIHNIQGADSVGFVFEAVVTDWAQ